MPDNVVVIDQDISTKALGFVRKVGDSSEALPRDGSVLSSLQSWLIRKGIIVAGNRHFIKFDSQHVYQLANVRPDVHCYTVTFYCAPDCPDIINMIEQGNNISSEAQPYVSDIISGKTSVVWGKLFWFRFIKPAPNKLDTDGAVIEEIYWIDVFARFNEIAFPLLRLYYDSIGLVPDHWEFALQNIEKTFTERIPLFIDSNRIILNWHEFAERFGLARNLFYLRACFENSGIEGVFAAISGMFWITPAKSRYYGTVYQPEGIYGPPLGGHFGTVNPSFSLNPNQTLAEQTGTLTLQEYISYVNNCGGLVQMDLYSYNLEEGFFAGPPPEEYPNQDTSDMEYPQITNIPQPTLFPEQSIGGQDFLFFIESVFGSIVQYIGSGNFLVSYEASSHAAVESETRGSAFVDDVIAAVKQVAGPDLSTGVTGPWAAGGAAAPGAAALGDAVTGMRRSNRDRQRLKRRIVHDGRVCANKEDVTTEAECINCVTSKGNLGEEMRERTKDVAIELAFDIGGGMALGCAAGALIAFVPVVNVGVGLACLFGLINGVTVGSGIAIYDAITHKTALNDVANDAFEPCYTMPITIDIPN